MKYAHLRDPRSRSLLLTLALGGLVLLALGACSDDSTPKTDTGPGQDAVLDHSGGGDAPADAPPAGDGTTDGAAGDKGPTPDGKALDKGPTPDGKALDKGPASDGKAIDKGSTADKGKIDGAQAKDGSTTDAAAMCVKGKFCPVASGTTVDLRGVTYCQAGDFGVSACAIVVGKSGTILRLNWTTGVPTALSSGTTEDLYAVAQAFLGATSDGGSYLNDTLAVGGNGTILRHAFGTGGWTKVATGLTTNDLYAITAGYSAPIVVGAAGTILRYDSGTWSKITSPTTQNLYSVVNINGSLVVAVGANGTIIRSTDGGETWTSMTSATTAHLYGVRAMTLLYGNGYVVAAGQGGAGVGAAFTPSSVGTFAAFPVGAAGTNDYYDAAFAASVTGLTAKMAAVAVGAQGFLGTMAATGTVSGPGTPTFTTYATGTTQSLRAVTPTITSTGTLSNPTFVVGDGGTILRLVP